MSNDAPTAREFGQLEERVRALDSKFGDLVESVDRLTSKVDHLTALAERGKGAYWSALGIASGIGGLVAWAAKTFGGKVPGG